MFEVLKLNNIFCPAEKWIKTFLPDKRKSTDVNHFDTVADWCIFSNAKAILANARGKGAVYPEVEPFYPAEIKPINARQNEV